MKTPTLLFCVIAFITFISLAIHSSSYSFKNEAEDWEDALTLFYKDTQHDETWRSQIATALNEWEKDILERHVNDQAQPLNFETEDDEPQVREETNEEWWVFTPEKSSDDGVADQSNAPSTTLKFTSEANTLGDDEAQNEWFTLFSSGNVESEKESEEPADVEEVDDNSQTLVFEEASLTLDTDEPLKFEDKANTLNFAADVASATSISLLSDLEQGIQRKLGIDTTKRDVRLTQNNQQLKLMARSKNSETGDKSAFRLVMDASADGALSAFDFFQKGNEEDKSGYRFRINLYKIVEWKPAFDGQTYDANNGTAVSVYDIGSKGWTKFDGKTFKISSKTVGEEKLFTFEATTADGVFTVRGHAAGRAVTDQKLSLNANKVKFDYIINNFPYQGKDGETKLVLKAKVMTRALPRSKVNSDGGELTVGDADNSNSTAVAFFNWESNVSLDNGEVVPVVSSALQETEDVFQTEPSEVENQVYFTLQTTKHSNKITWDPSLGINTSSSSVTMLSIMAVVMSALLLVFM